MRSLLLFGGLAFLSAAALGGACAIDSSGPPASSAAVAPSPATTASGREIARTASTAAAASAIAASSEAATPPEPAPRGPFAFANIDPEDDGIVAPPDARPSCEADLAAAGIRFRAASLAVHTAGNGKKNKLTCGAPQVVLYQGSPAKIRYEPGVLLTCTMALALAHFEAIVDEEAERSFGKRVTLIHHLGTYSCREMLAFPGWVSEHSYANAIDLKDFVLEDGRVIDVLSRFQPTLEEPKTKESAFLRTIARRAFDEETFSHVLTPFFDRVHANHFHLDLARYQGDGTRYLGDPAIPLADRLKALAP